MRFTLTSIGEVQNNFSKILGERLLKITKVSEDTGIARSTLTRIYYKKNKAISFDVLVLLCDYLDIELSELISYKPIRKEER
ncbi:helix-turn-helix domain-containing protein [Brochothrix thermosphacta]|uniref:helix-turn-helix domain-containing protein n=1 Tax=Brochothrix thermosphacta TaxID=2756 RepID=UPI0009BEA996|nr:helix-turn-helix transcriptional regulator [Brochothrix thermosphacta]